MVQKTLVVVSLGIGRGFGPPRRNMLELNMENGYCCNTIAVVCVSGSRSEPALDEKRIVYGADKQQRVYGVVMENWNVRRTSKL